MDVADETERERERERGSSKGGGEALVRGGDRGRPWCVEEDRRQPWCMAEIGKALASFGDRRSEALALAKIGVCGRDQRIYVIYFISSGKEEAEAISGGEKEVRAVGEGEDEVVEVGGGEVRLNESHPILLRHKKSSPSTHRQSSPWTRPKKKPSSSTHPPLLRHSSLSRSTPGVNRADLEPTQTEIRPKDLSTPVTFGISLGSGEYFTRVGVGSPAKQFYMVLDTGSDVNSSNASLAPTVTNNLT
ncbi:hypothetical protein ACLB2K_019612 [Fragaria x ananassa]